ncbi:hypothetical protein STW0522KLE44_31080 [Klebsiella sp. STW0522-44]|jgi:hypothetical protein|nr:hypothetical protein STW0522KLE44_31080 [Klebsiella sp. STW0522-44]
MGTTGIMTAKVSLRTYMKPLLILSALLRWDWLTNKCFKVEVVTGDTVHLDSK